MHARRRHSRTTAVVAALLAAIITAAASPASAAPGATCHISDESALDAIGQISPLFDDGRRLGRELGDARRVDGTEVDGYVAFTFDDGPSATTTPRVLAALQRYDVPATFFVVGRRIRGASKGTQKNVATLRETLAAGFLVGNHTVDHFALTSLPLERAHAQIEDNARIVAGVLGSRPHLFRPPYGSANPAVRRLLADAGDTEVLWSIDPKDFLAAGKRTLRKRVVAAVVRGKGGVVLLHDTKLATAQAIGGILDDLEAENCRQLGAGGPLIVPVSLHYFLREHDGTPRPIPAAVTERTEAYRRALPDRCAARTSDGRPPN